MGVDHPYLYSSKCIFFALGLESQNCAEVNHATHSQTYNDSSSTTAGLHHGTDELGTGTFEVGIASDRLDLVRYIVMFEKLGKDSAGA